jgi:hypothetical protein
MAATTGDLLSHQPPTGGILRDLIQKNMSSFRLKNEVNTPQWDGASLGERRMIASGPRCNYN